MAQVARRANELGTPLRIGVNSGSLPAHLRDLEYENPVEALKTIVRESPIPVIADIHFNHTLAL